MNKLSLLLRRKHYGSSKTARELAELSGVPKATLSDYERGKSVPQADKLARLCHAYGITLHELCEALDLFKEESNDSERSTADKRADCSN